MFKLSRSLKKTLNFTGNLEKKNQTFASSKDLKNFLKSKNSIFPYFCHNNLQRTNKRSNTRKSTEKKMTNLLNLKKYSTRNFSQVPMKIRKSDSSQKFTFSQSLYLHKGNFQFLFKKKSKAFL